MSRLRLQVVQPLRESDDDSWVATVRMGKRRIEVEIRPVEVEFSGAVRAAGSVVRAELEAHRSDAVTHVNVTRQADHLLATADWNGASVVRRASKLEAFEEALWRFLRAETSCHFFWGESWVQRAHDGMDEALAWLEKALAAERS